MATKAEFPGPASFMHWTHLISMIVLVFTGFYIAIPFFVQWMATARWLHITFAFIVLINLGARLYWALFGRSASVRHQSRLDRDYRNFWRQPHNKGQLVQILKYYVFLRKTHPATGKYNPMQKLTYGFWGLLLLFQGFTGFILLWPNTQFWGGTMLGLFGSLMMVRTIHYLVMWVFIVTGLVHIYLSLVEDWAGFKMMFFRVGSEK